MLCMWVIIVTMHGTNNMKFLLEWFIVTQLLKNCLAFNSTLRSITTFTKVSQLDTILSQHECMQFHTFVLFFMG